MDISQGMGSSFSLISGVVSVLALGMFALFNEDGDDDDDSTPGGGLMQPVA
ncbi:hypothetical protein [Synechococcus sp. RSCCF101]|uniref:hypothetical protein n=1 Tax=Synechococcus sp. RSCCF101 TaxID=2511069 RepID=UPI001781CA52|nr:hypothetical protein [Synechococcus sp. RSCCF101]